MQIASAITHRSSRQHLRTRLASVARQESALFAFAVGVIGLHVVDDNFLEPARGASPQDHLASGFVPVAILALVVSIYPRLRAGARAATAMTAGAIGVTVGIPGLYYLLDGSASGDHYTGLLALVAGGALLFLLGPVTLWRGRRTG